jgi:hypothetical protein
MLSAAARHVPSAYSPDPDSGRAGASSDFFGSG